MAVLVTPRGRCHGHRTCPDGRQGGFAAGVRHCAARRCPIGRGHDCFPLALASTKPLYEGNNRVCYPHPDDGSLLVKIIKPCAHPHVLRRGARKFLRRMLPLRHYDIQYREIRAYRVLFRRVGPGIARFIPPVHGMVETDLGPGLVTDFVRDADGMPGTALPDLLCRGYDAEAAESVERLRRFLVECGVSACDFSPPNVVLARHASGVLEAKLVDGFGNVDYIPGWQWSLTIARRGARRAVRKFDRKLAILVKEIRSDPEGDALAVRPGDRAETTR